MSVKSMPTIALHIRTRSIVKATIIAYLTVQVCIAFDRVLSPYAKPASDWLTKKAGEKAEEYETRAEEMEARARDAADYLAKKDNEKKDES